jgi:HSP20 family protein
MERLRREIDNLLDRFFEGWPFGGPRKTSEWMPQVDVSETFNSLVIQVEMPGMEPKDVDISLKRNLLTIRGERKQVQGEEEENFHQIERSYGSFSRTISLPVNVDEEKVEAHFKNGVLKIIMPKGEEERVKKIEVKG